MDMGSRARLGAVTPPLPLFSAAPALVLGYAAMGITVLIWAGFSLSIRAIGASPLAAADVALIRFGLPALLLLPFLPSRLPLLRRIGTANALMVLVGAGLPFFFIASAGGKATSATLVGALTAGTAPLSVALLAGIIERRRIGKARWRAIGVIVTGVAVLVALPAGAPRPAPLGGAGMLLLASLLWGLYTIGLRRVGLDAIACTLLLSLPSLLLTIALVLTGAVDSHIGHFTAADALPFLLVQGLGVGVIASLSYALAIRRLGPARSSAIGAFAPAVACLMAAPLLGESLTPPIACAIAAITVGVILANRAQA